jgi:hypothetical protein
MNGGGRGWIYVRVERAVMPLQADGCDDGGREGGRLESYHPACYV